MSRTLVNFFLDLSLLIVLAGLTAVSVITEFAFPPATSAQGWMLWGYNYDAWSRFRFGLLCLFLLGVLVHVMLHWTWVCGVVITRLLGGRGKDVLRDDGLRTLYGVTTLITFLTVVGTAVAAAILSVEKTIAG